MESHKSSFTFPCVTVEQMIAYRKDRPETWTKSQLVNAVLEAIEIVRPVNCDTVGSFIGLDSPDVKYGLHAMTGMTLRELMEVWRKARFKKLLDDAPEITPRDMVKQLAFSSQGALWTFLTKQKLIEPLGWHWNLPQYMKLRQEVERETLGKSDWKDRVENEVQRRKWIQMTKNKK